MTPGTVMSCSGQVSRLPSMRASPLSDRMSGRGAVPAAGRATTGFPVSGRDTAFPTGEAAVAAVPGCAALTCVGPATACAALTGRPMARSFRAMCSCDHCSVDGRRKLSPERRLRSGMRLAASVPGRRLPALMCPCQYSALPLTGSMSRSRSMPDSGRDPSAVKRSRLMSASRRCRFSTGIRPSGFTTAWILARPSASVPFNTAGRRARSPSTVSLALYGHCWA